MADFRGGAADTKRAMMLIRKREMEKEENERKKQKIADEASAAADIKNKFATFYDVYEEQLKDTTVGLVSLDEMRAKQTQIIKQKETELVAKCSTDVLKSKNDEEAGYYSAPPSGSLSFNFEEEEEDEEEEEKPIITKKLTKNPNVDTSFLPDRRRDEEETRLREALMQEWNEKQQKVKDEVLKIEFSYWDGSGHKREMFAKKGVTIHQFLYKCLEQLRGEGQFPELRAVGVDQLMFIKEDMILPHHSSFYDLIISKARGKNGLIFTANAEPPKGDSPTQPPSKPNTVEAEKVENVKIALRNWYDKNKHIYPASRWDAYDPEKNYDTEKN